MGWLVPFCGKLKLKELGILKHLTEKSTSNTMWGLGRFTLVGAICSGTFFWDEHFNGCTENKQKWSQTVLWLTLNDTSETMGRFVVDWKFCKYMFWKYEEKTSKQDLRIWNHQHLLHLFTSNELGETKDNVLPSCIYSHSCNQGFVCNTNST